MSAKHAGKIVAISGGASGIGQAIVLRLAQEGARVGVTVNAICPGYIATDMVKAMSQEVLQKNVLPLIPIGRLGEPEEVARCVVFLAADAAGLITGSTITANGGQYFA